MKRFAKWYWYTFEENPFPIIIGILVAFIALFFSCTIKYSTNETYYEIATQNMMTTNVKSDVDCLCSYPGCLNKAEKVVKSGNCAIEHDEDKAQKAVEMLLTIPNKAGFGIKTNNFTYRDKSTGVRIDNVTFIIPQADGSFRVENRKEYTETTHYGDAINATAVYLDGAYCNSHVNRAKEILCIELEDLFLHSFGYWLLDNMILSLIITVISVGISFGLYKLFERMVFPKATMPINQEQ